MALQNARTPKNSYLQAILVKHVKMWYEKTYYKAYKRIYEILHTLPKQPPPIRHY